jgi:signal peptidase II
MRFPYYVFSIIAALAILYMFVRVRVTSRLRQLALALIFGGAIGNLIDRVRWGEVVDFIEVGVPSWHWPVFNIADSAVSVGVVLFALTWRHHEQTAASQPPVNSPHDAEPRPSRPFGSGVE